MIRFRQQPIRQRPVLPIFSVLLTGLFLLFITDSAFALTVQMQPEKVEMGLGYHGSHFTVSGQRQPEENVIVRISSDPTDTHLKYKGKAGGIFWMKLGDILFKNAPSVYVVYATQKLESLLSDDALKENTLGYQALSRNIEIESNQRDFDESFWLSEYLKFKEHDQLYVVDDSVSREKSGADDNRFQYEIDWPYQAPPGTYKLEAFAVQNQQVTDHAMAEFTVERGGLVALLSDMAFNRAVLYGILAILVAAAAGFGVGLIFKSGGSH